VSLVDQGLRFGEWLGLSWILPSIGIGYSGSAKLCTSDHMQIFVSGLEPPPAPLHIDVDMKLWNKTPRSLTVFEPRRAKAAGQVLEWEEPGYMGAFKEATLSPDGARVDEDFRVDPPGDDELLARAGDKLTVDLTRNRGRRLRVRFTVKDPKRLIIQG
jgi:hypothetical protein